MPVEQAARTRSQSSALKKDAPRTKLSSVNLDQYKQEIWTRAQEIYEERLLSNIPGDALGDWLKAESEIKKRYEDA